MQSQNKKSRAFLPAGVIWSHASYSLRQQPCMFAGKNAGTESQRD